MAKSSQPWVHKVSQKAVSRAVIGVMVIGSWAGWTYFHSTLEHHHRQILARAHPPRHDRQPEAERTGSLVRGSRLEQALYNAVRHTNTGVLVLYAPLGAGKSSAVQHVAQRLEQERAIDGHIHLRLQDSDHDIPTFTAWLQRQLSPLDSISRWLQRGLGLPGREDLPIAHFMPQTPSGRPLLLIVDDFDLIGNFPSMLQHIQASVASWASSSVSTRKFLLLLICHDATTAELVLSMHTKARIRLVDYDTYKLTEQEVNQLVHHLLPTGNLSLPHYLLDGCIAIATPAAVEDLCVEFAQGHLPPTRLPQLISAAAKEEARSRLVLDAWRR